MTAPWGRVIALFEAARQLDPEPRRAFLDLACASNTTLREEVDALLHADRTGESFLDAPHGSAPLGLPAAVLEPGTLLRDRYRVGAPIAPDGQALIYRAEDLVLQQPVVIKVIRAQGRGSPLFMARLRREMEALATVDHPGVVGILDSGELVDGSPFVVLQHVAGRSLRAVLGEAALSRDQVADLIAQIASALAAIHAAGITHGDLNPENVMVEETEVGRPRVVVTGFGLSTIGTGEHEPSTTMILIAGTARYMAPEQLEGRQCPASDTYALALMACEMLSGHPDPRALPRSTARPLRATLDAALAYRPEDRPADTTKWSRALARRLHLGSRRTVTSATVLLISALVGLGAVAAFHLTRDTFDDMERIVEVIGAVDPSALGFRVDHDVTGSVATDSNGAAVEAWRVVTGSQGHYFQPLTSEQKGAALQRGWRLSAGLKVAEGAGHVGLDFSPIGRRFDIVVMREGPDEVVRLVTQIIPTYQGMELHQSPGGGYHDYTLTYDPGQQTAELWIDGNRRLAGYSGHQQFGENKGLLMTTQVWKSARASADFRSVRFEVDP